MSELREVFEMVTKQTDPDVDAWKDQERRQRRRSRNRRLSALALAAAIGIVALVVVIRAGDEEAGEGAGDEADDEQDDDEPEHDGSLPWGCGSFGTQGTSTRDVPDGKRSATNLLPAQHRRQDVLDDAAPHRGC